MELFDTGMWFRRCLTVTRMWNADFSVLVDFERDVDIKHDSFVTNPSLESRGVGVLFRSQDPESRG